MHRLLSRLSAALRHSRFRRLRDENGSVLFVSAAAMLVLCGVTGLGVDVGMWYRTKRAMQNAADSAAMAAALDNGAATYQAAGKAVAAQYGFVDGSGGVNVAVANAQSCPGGGTSNCYTATVSQQAPQYFSQVLGIAAPTLSASATASPATTGANDCVLALNPTASSAVLLNGTVSINLSCGLAVNSSSSQALLMNGTNSITATSVDVVGNVLRNPSAGNPITPAATTGAASTPDPYAGLAVPSLPGGGCASPTSYNGANQTWNLSAGVKYCSNLTFNGANDTVNFAPGTYYFDRASLVVNGSGITLNGTGVTFVFTTSTGSGVGGLTMNGQVTAHLSAPTAGSGQPLPGFVFYQDRRASAGGNVTFNGNPSSQVTGALYFPSQKLTFNGQGTSTGCTQIIADTITFNGTPHLATSTCVSAYGLSMIGGTSSGAKLVR